MAAIRTEKGWGFINARLENICLSYFEEARAFSEELAAVKKYGKWGYIDRSTNNVIPYKYEEDKNFSEGLAAVKLYGKWRFVDLSGKSRIQFRYNGIANDFQYGFASVYDSGGNLSYIDKNGDTYSENDTLALNSIRYTMPDGKSFKYSNDSPLEFAKVDIKYNFDEFIDTSAPAQESGKIQNINL